MAKPIHGHRPIHAAGKSSASPTAGRGRPALQDPPKTPRRGRCPYRPGRRSHWTVGDAGPYGGLPHIHRRDVLKAVPYDDHAPTGANHGEANSWSSTNSCRRQIIRIPPRWDVLKAVCPPLRQPIPGRWHDRQSGRCLESASLHLPQAALRRFPLQDPPTKSVGAILNC